MPKFVYASMPGEEKPVQGRILSASAWLEASGTNLAIIEIALTEAPYQLNNMTRWLQVAMAKMRDIDFRRAWEIAHDRCQYVVNDGIGAKSGRGRYDNTFTYVLWWPEKQINFKLHIRIVTESHQNAHHKRIRSGEFVATPKKKIDYLHISRRTGEVMIPQVNRLGNVAFMSMEAEDYYINNPEARGTLEVI